MRVYFRGRDATRNRHPHIVEIPPEGLLHSLLRSGAANLSLRTSALAHALKAGH